MSLAFNWQNPVCIWWLIAFGKGSWRYRGLNNNSSYCCNRNISISGEVSLWKQTTMKRVVRIAATSGLPWAHFPRLVAFWENSFSVKGGNSFKLCDWSCTPECAPWSSGEPESTGSARRRSVIRCKQGYPEASIKNTHYTLHLLSKKCSPVCLLFIRATYADVFLAQFIWSLMRCGCKMMTDNVQSCGLYEGNKMPT